MPSVDVGADWSDPSLPGKTLGLIGVSLPLPLWNRGGAAVARARAEARQSAYAAAEARREATQRLGELRVRLAESAERARIARDSLVPAARDVRARATRAWQSGQTGVVPVLEALRAEREVAAAAIDELLTFQAVRADRWRLLGGER
jgi:cobalt-zinc-cadmium efflux system outer membrane protein